MLAVKNFFSADDQSLWPSRPLKGPFCGTRGEGGGVMSANFCITSGEKSPRWWKKNSAENKLFWHSRPLKRPFCGMRGEGVVSRVPLFASRGATSQLKEPRVMQKVARVTPPPHLEWHKKAFSKVEKAKMNDFQRQNFFSLRAFLPFPQPMW